MELRVLKYFLTVAREESILGASNVLHVTQPTLSRQLRELEEELGKQLFVRGSRKITLTDEGLLLRQRAAEIIGLVEKTEQEIQSEDDDIKGTLHLGCADMDVFEIIAKTMKEIRDNYPGIHFHIHSGDGIHFQHLLNEGILDFSMMIDPVDIEKYDFIRFPNEISRCGLVVKADSPLAKLTCVKKDNLKDIPLIVPRLFNEQGFFLKWYEATLEDCDDVIYYETPYDGLLMVRAGLGSAVTIYFKQFLDNQDDLAFIPLDPPLYTNVYIAWKKFQFLSKPAECFLKFLQKEIDAQTDLPESR